MLKETEDQSFNNYSNRVEAEKVLVMLGHEETIKRLVEKMRNPKARLGALSEATENAIPYLMPLVYSGSTEDPNEYGTPGWDVVLMPVRDRAVGLVLGCIIHGGKFPMETRKWAEQLFPEMNFKNETSIAILTSWWEHNQTAVLEKRYADASWLPHDKSNPPLLGREGIQRFRADEERKHFPSVSGGGSVITTVRSRPWLFISIGILFALPSFLVFGLKLNAKRKRTRQMNQ